LERVKDLYRRARIATKRAIGTEPSVGVDVAIPLEFHGNDYCGWSIPKGALNARSVVVDVGLGEDISFSRSLIDRSGCIVHGFDPTPRAIHYIRRLAQPNFVLHEFGVSAEAGRATFYLPNNTDFVSGSLHRAGHLGESRIDVPLTGIRDVFGIVGSDRINLLKLDIEGSEYDLISSAAFLQCAERIDLLCVEFHHRWQEFGCDATLSAVATLKSLGYRCAWRSRTTNEEFLFVNRRQ
jgi:FkbM family methyltransferase